MCHGERTTADVALQDRKGRHPRMSLLEQSGKHTMEECMKLTELKREVEKKEIVEWWTPCHSKNRKRKKGDVGVENEKEKQEGEKMERFFNAVHEFLQIPFVIYSQIALLFLFLCHLQASSIST